MLDQPLRFNMGCLAAYALTFKQSTLRLKTSFSFTSQAETIPNRSFNLSTVLRHLGAVGLQTVF